MTDLHPTPPVYSFGLESDEEQHINDKIVEAFLQELVEKEFLTGTAEVDWAQFRELQAQVTAAFDVPVSSITTRMARLLFALSRIQKPRTILCAGSAWGNALVWLSGGTPEAFCIGIDVDPEVSEIARRNFAALGHDVTIMVADARAVSDRLPAIDLLLLDADDPETGKGILVEILRALGPVLHDATMVLAHDSSLPTFAKDFDGYRSALVTRGARRTMNLPIDRCGLEVTLL